jgi:hypothetical protein
VFHVGSNSSCRQHIHGHYTLYQERCAALSLRENHHAVPRDIVKARVKVEREGQQTLNGVVGIKQPNAFTRDGVLKAVAEFVVCDDQVSYYSIRISISLN